ncbi:reverse transcriptase domain-containing protein [Tanacetum coccineum]
METSKPLLKDKNAEDVDVHLYRSMIGSLMYLTSLRPDIMFLVYACARFLVTPKVEHLHAVKRIFRYLKGQPKSGLWYPKDSPFDLEAYTDSDYADLTVIKEWEDRMERAATTTSSLEAEQDSGNINRTQSMATPNESFPHGTDSGSGPRDTENEAVRLMMFLISLTGEEKTWLDELNEGTIETWDELRTAYISRFCPPALFDRLLREIQALSQHENESLTNAWLRMKEMLKNFHGHNLSKAGGIFLYKTQNQAYQLLENKVAVILTQKVMARVDAMTMKMDHQYKEFQSRSGPNPDHNDDDIPIIDAIDEILEEDFDALLDDGSKILHFIKGTILKEKLFAEFDEFMAMTADENFVSEFDTEEERRYGISAPRLHKKTCILNSRYGVSQFLHMPYPAG